MQTNNQIQLSTILAAHYSATRNSVETWVARRDQYINWFLVGAYADIGYFLGAPARPHWVLYLIGPVTILVLFAYIGADLHVAYLCKWLNNEYTPMLNRYCNDFDLPHYDPWHWDNSQSVRKFYQDGPAAFRYVTLILVFCATNIGAYAAYFFRAQTSDSSILLCMTIIVSIIAAGVILYIYFVRHVMAVEGAPLGEEAGIRECSE